MPATLTSPVAQKKAPPLPMVNLKQSQIPLAVLSLIPLQTVQKFQVSAFEINNSVLKLAIVYPDQLKQGFYTALLDIGEKIHRKIELYRTDSASIQNLVNQYRELQKGGTVTPMSTQSPMTAKGALPVSSSNLVMAAPLFELGKTVAYNYLKRIPLAFAQSHRIVCVDYLPPNSYWFVIDGTHAETIQTVLPFIETHNHIQLHSIRVSKHQLDDLLGYYAAMTEKEKRGESIPEPVQKVAPAAPAVAPVVLPKTEAKSVEIIVAPLSKLEPAPEVTETVPQTGVVAAIPQGELISTEEERGGIAGLFQRMAHSLTGKAEEDFPAPPVVPLSKPKPVAPAPASTVPATTSSANPVPAAAKPAAAPAKEQVIDADGELGKVLSKSVVSIDELKDYIRKGSIPEIVAAVVSFAIHEKASDIHIESFQDEVRVRYRVDGQLIDVVKLAPDVHAAMVSRIKILSRLRLDETRIPQDGRFDVNFNDAQVDLRVSVMPTVHGEKVVMRILDKSRGITSLESLGIMGLAYQNLVAAINRPFGICLATGPTGSGKSTTLYAILSRIATPNVNVITLEDPVEYEMKGINQSQIRPKIGFTFAEGLRAILRQDPNIIMVGEIRDGETANMATQAALTGHLVLSTLHTNEAAGAIPRLSNMGIEPFLITSSLNIAIGQRLVRKICQNCKSEVSLPQGIRDQIAKDVEVISHISPEDSKRIPESFKFYQGKGCSVCGGKGYQGRLGIYEVLIMSEAIEELTLKHASGSQIQEQAQKEGMITMYQDGLLKVLSGLTTLDEVLRETTTK